jgi:hypothetical protein
MNVTAEHLERARKWMNGPREWTTETVAAVIAATEADTLAALNAQAPPPPAEPPTLRTALERIRVKADAALRTDNGQWAKQALDAIDEIAENALRTTAPPPQPGTLDQIMAMLNAQALRLKQEVKGPSVNLQRLHAIDEQADFLISLAQRIHALALAQPQQAAPDALRSILVRHMWIGDKRACLCGLHMRADYWVEHILEQLAQPSDGGAR